MAIRTHAPVPPELMDVVHKLRYQAFCIENKWEPENSLKRESEPGDAKSLFVLAYEDDIPIGTLRITPLTNGFGFIGRVVLLQSCKDRPAVRTALIQGLMKVSSEAGITHWFGLMEDWFIKSANSYGLSWEQIGPDVEKNGPRKFVHMRALGAPPNTDPHFQPYNPKAMSFWDAISG